jgi:hypothetical protein
MRTSYVIVRTTKHGREFALPAVYADRECAARVAERLNKRYSHFAHAVDDAASSRKRRARCF